MVTREPPGRHLAHVTVVHARYDTRILFKQCVSLARSGLGAVSLFVADGKGDESCEGVLIRDVGKTPLGRLGRMLVGSARVWVRLRRERADLVHLHDPELLMLGLILHLSGTRVVFDMHENLPKEILTKTWVSTPARRIVSSAARLFQSLACRMLPTVFAEKSYVQDFSFAKMGTVVLNYPLVDALAGVVRTKREKFTIGYIGGVSYERGADVIVEAVSSLRVEHSTVETVIVGPVAADISENPTWKQGISEGWSTVTGRLIPGEGWALMASCHVGVALLRPSPNFVDSYPTKLFEYMALGLPVIVSDFPLWRSIVDDARCGLMVDPTDVSAVKDAFLWAIAHPDEAAAMGLRGREVVLNKYNWASEFRKLHNLYLELLTA
jgi:glycosyltransferase involved in cell wall biosynthesis